VRDKCDDSDPLTCENRDNIKRKCLESNDGRRYEPGKVKYVKSEFLGCPQENNDKISGNGIEEKITT
jgi:hypothetical protein